VLYGKKPFGDGVSQERLQREGIMRNVRTVEFPDKPTVSEPCKVHCNTDSHLIFFFGFFSHRCLLRLGVYSTNVGVFT
jgi:hypothetical protein